MHINHITIYWYNITYNILRSDHRLNKEEMKSKLSNLIQEYKQNKLDHKSEFTEETIRSYLNEFLSIFGWDTKKLSEVIQEKKLGSEEKSKLKEIDSTHNKPDYQLVNGKNIKTFLDAKDIKVDLIKDKEVAFQIRSYGWSAQIPCAFVSNFEQMGVYQCLFTPKKGQETNLATKFINIDDYIDEFEFLYEHFYKENIYNNKLQELYNLNTINPSDTLDSQFMKVINDFRIKLASNLIKKNTDLKSDSLKLNYYTQIIINRILFIRFSEAKGIEKKDLLISFKNQDFWEKFKSECITTFVEHYDGAMFTIDPGFENLNIDNDIFNEFIESLYYPSPYKFDVIPVSLIAEIYEYFLSKQITVKKDEVSLEWKKIYQKLQGAVSTDRNIVNYISQEILEVNNINSVDEILKLRILDPACGSGTFLVVVYEILEQKMIDLRKNNYVDSSYLHWFIENEDSYSLTIQAKREILKNCIYGIDIDPTAVEVSKMSLAMKMLEDVKLSILYETGVFGKEILKEFHDNIAHGNTLVDENFYDTDNNNEDEEVAPFDIDRFFENIIDEGGFTHILGNPPYVEPKYYTEIYPNTYKYIKKSSKIVKGKVDISLFFIEKSIKLLRENGKIGLITQKRFFKTEYGEKLRKLLGKNQLIYKLLDFKSNSLFKGVDTYITILFMQKINNSSVDYVYVLPNKINDLDKVLKDSSNLVELNIPSEYLVDNLWSHEIFGNLPLVDMAIDLGASRINDIEDISIETGIQVLWNKIYRLYDVIEISNSEIEGKNGFGNTVKIEKAAAKKLFLNEKLYCMKSIEDIDTWVIFPYEDDKVTPIPFTKFASDYPLAAKYLSDNKTLIMENVQTRENDVWHCYTRVQNHELYEKKKIFVPMTSKDVIGIFSGNNTIKTDNEIFADNANVYQMIINNGTDEIFKSMTCILNSTIFSMLAKLFANPQLNDNFKFSKQFLKLVPIPYKSLISNPEALGNLSTLYDEIYSLQISYKNAIPSKKETLAKKLYRKWDKLDDYVLELYQFEEEIKEHHLYTRGDRVNIINF